MIRILRPLSALALCFTLVLTASAMAQARGQMRAASGAIVLCTGTGPVTVVVDENGAPLGRIHICPDCALSLIAGLLPLWQLPQKAARAQRLVAIDMALHATPRALPIPAARAPPFA
ncbi:hypothetical protein AQS8620_03133 [Aquimixticola soesokkakensis]|uniref:Uncharacterized protein n=2 Tax=Aquimixticola soesokkakensis TaxID=1519096 RepID=A0A1Y5TSJ0_9RHOB|nr:hypothetical protein AQS8620_03133 [Aquimixticola soesokkakensis]